MSKKVNRATSLSILSAILYSHGLCCIVPGLAFISGATPVLAWIAPLKPYLSTISVTTLGFSWYQKLRPQKKKQDQCCNHPQDFWHSKMFLGIVTVFVLVTQALPLFQSKLYSTTSKGYCETHHQHGCCKPQE